MNNFHTDLYDHKLRVDMLILDMDIHRKKLLKSPVILKTNNIISVC